MVAHPGISFFRSIKLLTVLAACLQWRDGFASTIGLSFFTFGLAGCQDDGPIPWQSTTSTDDTTEGSTALADETSGNPTSSTNEGIDSASTSGAAPECGNGIRELDEQCDGESVAGIPCPDACSFPPMTLLWELHFDVDAASRDSVLAVAGTPDGRVVVGGEADSEAWIALISPTGELEWIERPEADEVGSLVVIDADAFVAGGTRDTGMWISRYDGSGGLVWQDTVESPSKLAHYFPGSVTRMADGRIALVGSADIGGTEPGYLALYTLGGTLDELQAFAAPIFDRRSMTGDFLIYGTAVGEDLLVSGRALLPMFGDVPWLQKRGLDGSVHWERSLISPAGGGTDRFVQASADTDGGISVAADYGTIAADPGDIWIGSYSVDGELRWEDVYIGQYGREDYPVGVAVDSLGRTFTHGTISDDDHAEQADRNYDMVVLSHGVDGERRWSDIYSGDGIGGGAYSFDYAGAIAVDTRGFVLVAGYTMTPETDYDVLVRLLAP